MPRPLTPYVLLTPLVGVGLFVGLYLMATYLYPGGSRVDKLAVGFSWPHNYWCDLMDVYAINGKLNPARPVAITALSLLSLSMVVLWYYLPQLFIPVRYISRLIQVPGILAMGVAPLVATSLHNQAIGVASGFAAIALVSTLIGLYKSRLQSLLQLGSWCLLLMAVNNYIYYSSQGLYYLPLLQKIAFAFVLIWISSLTVALYARQRINYATR